ncbi:hypothetical protein PHMEG_00025545, partial [Phytophthora megakarya]
LFSRGRLLLPTTLRLMLFWASGLPVGRAQEFLDISNKTFCRDICTKEMLLCPMEVNETSLKKKSKFGRGRQHEDHWLFGGVDRNTGRWFGILEIRIKRYIKAMRGIPKERLPPYLDVLWKSWYFNGTVPSCQYLEGLVVGIRKHYSV